MKVEESSALECLRSYCKTKTSTRMLVRSMDGLGEGVDIGCLALTQWYRDGTCSRRWRNQG
jgi:hypothetical protein